METIIRMEVEKFMYNKKQSNSGEICLICEKKKKLGIHLFHSFICLECEQEIVHTKTSDPRYHFYIYRMGKAWVTPDRQQRIN